MNYLIYLLSLLLMLLLSSCRSPKTMTTTTATADSVKISLKDSTTQRFSFSFDSLEIWRISGTQDLGNSGKPSAALQRSRSPEIQKSVVYGGKLTTTITTLSSQDSTSNKTSQESRTTKIRSDPITPTLLLLIISGIIILLFITYKYRKRVS